MALTVEIGLPSDLSDEIRASELRSLTEALKASYIPRSSVVERPAAGTVDQMGVGTELLVHLSDSAGVAALVTVLTSWLRSRRVTVDLVRRRGKKVDTAHFQYSGKTPEDVRKLLASWIEEE